MRKIFFLFGVVLVISYSVKSQQIAKYTNFENDWERDNLYGHVKELIQYKSGINTENDTSEKRVLMFKKRYSSFGKILSEENYNETGELYQNIDVEYNDSNLYRKLVINNLEANIIATETVEYNAKGKKNFSETNFNDTLRVLTKAEYDSMNNLIKSISFKGIDTIGISTFDYKYDNFGRIIWKKQTNKVPDENDITINQFKFDEKGNMVEINSDNKFFGKMKSVYQYDSKNRIKKISHYRSGHINKEIIYDKNYNPIFKSRYDNSELITEFRFDYKFDKHGNWIKKETLVKKIIEKTDIFLISSTETRELIYFD